MITLEEAIQQNRDLADSNRDIYEETGHVCEHSLKAAEYFDQLASWLEELKALRNLHPTESASRSFSTEKWVPDCCKSCSNLSKMLEYGFCNCASPAMERVFSDIEGVLDIRNMRSATSTEVESVQNYISSISTLTGVNFNDF